MKATGIVRRIDDLGRIVIPKEIRRTLRIRETDPLEIYTEKTGEIVLKKYSPVGEIVEFAKDYADSLASTTGQIVCITDREQIIAATGNLKKELISKPITKELEEFIEQRTPVVANDSSRGGINIVEDKDIHLQIFAQALCPIISEGDALGAVVMLAKDEKQKYTNSEKMLVVSAADFIGKQMQA